jgi:thiosulfate dehydrogenase [quinone] large subunit
MPNLGKKGVRLVTESLKGIGGPSYWLKSSPADPAIDFWKSIFLLDFTVGIGTIASLPSQTTTRIQTITMSDTSCCQPKCCNEWAFAHLILRLWVGMRLLFAGLDKMRQKGGDGFGFEWIEKSMQPIVDNFVGNPYLPGFMLKPYAVVLPYALLISGLLVTLGLFTRWSLLAGGLTFISLAFGLMALPDDDQAVYRGIEVALTAFALITAAHNSLSVDALIFRKKSAA